MYNMQTISFVLPSQKRTIYYNNCFTTTKYFLLFPEMFFNVPYKYLENTHHDARNRIEKTTSSCTLCMPHYDLRYSYEGKLYFPLLPNIAVSGFKYCLNENLYRNKKIFDTVDQLKKYVIDSFFNDQFFGSLLRSEDYPGNANNWFSSNANFLFEEWKKHKTITKELIEKISYNPQEVKLIMAGKCNG